MKKYYFPNKEHVDRIFGEEIPVCIDQAEVERLCAEWGDIYSQFHDATEEEIAEYGVYDS